MKRILCVSMLSLGLLAACDKSSSSDPKTVGRDDLNSPRKLMTVTGNAQVELRWSAGNAEKEFKGFQVFVAKKSLATVADEVKYPKKGEDLTQASIPRCADNTALFELFGLPKSEADCEGDTAADAAATEKKAAGSSFHLIADDTTATTEKLAGMVACETGSVASVNGTDKDVVGTAAVSMPISGQALGDYRCVVSKDSEGDALVNGETYTFFVAAVMGDDYNKLSWTSNFVEDSPALPLFSDKITLKKSVDGTKNGHVAIFPGDKILALTTITAPVMTHGCDYTQSADATPGASDPSACFINRLNAKSGISSGIYFGRWGSSTYPQRMFVSVPAGGAIEINERGALTKDPANPTEISTSIPGDEAVDTAAAYNSKGTLFPVYGNQVFDIKFTGTDSKVHYGKLVIDVPTFAAPSTAVTDKELFDITIKVTLIVQPTALSTHYFN